MPTLPPEPAPVAAQAQAQASHQSRKMAESFGSDPERYHRSRPRYPDALVDRIVAASPGPGLLDVGIGTGIAARQFQAAGCRVLGVEVDPRMAEFARHGGFEVEVAKFEDWDPVDRTFDVVVAAQAWHWVDPVAGAAKAAQVLRPSGRFAAFWNVGRPQAEAVEAFAAVFERVVPDSMAARYYRRMPDAANPYSAILAKIADAVRDTGAFAEPEQWRFDWEKPYTRDEWLDEVPTQGEFSQFSPTEMTQVLAGLGTAVDAMGGGFTMHYTTAVLTAARTGSEEDTAAA